MTISTLLAITSHGNAPYLMAARLAYSLSAKVVIPLYYGETQKKILREEIRNAEKFVYLSPELGDLFRPLLLDVQNGMSFADWGAHLSQADNFNGVQQVENRLQEMLRNGIPATRLDGEDARRFTVEDFSAVINTTLPVRVPVYAHYFFFTARLSSLYGTAPDGEQDQQTQQAVEKLQPYARLWERVEDTFALMFTPRIHALSYRNSSDPKTILTPPYAYRRRDSHMLPEQSLLFLPSGTRTDVSKLNLMAESVPDGYQKLVLSGITPEDFSPEKFERVKAQVFSDPKLVAVIARGGWGTVWECLQNAKPLGVVKTTYVDDPEIGHTQVTLEKMGIGKVLNGSLKDFLEPENLATMKEEILRQRRIDSQNFNELAEDGIAYIAGHIREYTRIADQFQRRLERDKTGS